MYGKDIPERCVMSMVSNSCDADIAIHFSQNPTRTPPQDALIFAIIDRFQKLFKFAI
jgi:hypothetical protein